MTNKKPIIVSACLVGYNCRYDGGNKKTTRIAEMAEFGEAIPLCPEQLGSLPTPRRPAQIKGGDGIAVVRGEAKVVDISGQDVTEPFLKGAREVLKLARDLGVTEAILCEGSPSCGVQFTYVEGKKVTGMGVCAALLQEAGLKLVGENNDST